VTTAAGVHIRTAFLGYAAMSCIDNDDCGRGPVLQLNTINTRKPTKRRTMDFIVTCGGDPSDPTKPLTKLARFEPVNAIVVAIEPHFLDEGRLIANPHDVPSPDQIPRVNWEMAEEFEYSEAYVINGHGRLHFAETVLAPKSALRAYYKARNQLLTNPDDLDATIEMEQAQETLEGPTSWLFAFYNLSKCYTDD
jgi:hypothetical protein